MTMEKMSKATKGKRKTYTAEYQAEVVKICMTSGKSASAVARELGISVASVCSWVAQAKNGGTPSEQRPLSTNERAELEALRRENKKLAKDCEILRCATLHFAKRSMS
jgi:transposase